MVPIAETNYCQTFIGIGGSEVFFYWGWVGAFAPPIIFFLKIQQNVMNKAKLKKIEEKESNGYVSYVYNVNIQDIVHLSNNPLPLPLSLPLPFEKKYGSAADRLLCDPLGCHAELLVKTVALELYN